ncbi:MAG: cellulase family glycosylhydrolase [Isosphaeraceae bacterium]|nr:cellulase family glycosylhydrolase [Isosphaeraceae bacterium]
MSNRSQKRPRIRRGARPRLESMEARSLLTSAVFSVISDWGSGFTGEIRIENTEPAPVNDWRLEFDFAPTISPVWNGVVVSRSGSRYTIRGESWNKDVPQGGAVTFGFNAAPGNLGGAKPANFVLNGVPLDGGGTPPAPPAIAVDDLLVLEGDPPPTTGTPSPFFSTSGSQIVDASGKAVKLAGINWFGFETANYAPHGLWTRGYKDMMDQMKSLGFNTIRLPFSNQLFDAASKPNGIDFAKNPDLQGLSGLQIMDKIVDYAGKVGLRIMLDHHRSTAGNSAQSSGLWYTPEYPETRWISDWTMLAARYKGNAAVVAADLHNEPHGPATWGSGSPTTDWRLAAERAGNAILAVNPDWLIVVEGIEVVDGKNYWWGGNLKAAGTYPVRLQVPGRLVYSTHDYPQSVYDQRWFSDPSYPNNLTAIWDEYWGYLFKQEIAPVLIGEFGSRLATTIDDQWAAELVKYAGGDFDTDGDNDLAPGKQGPSWTWWSWNPNSGDTGGILLDDWNTVRTEALDLLKPIQFTLAPPTEGGGSTRYASFTVSLTKAHSQKVTLQYATVDGTAKAGLDYVAASGTLEFAPGETRKTVNVALVGDDLVESDETFTLRLSNSTNASIVDADGLAKILDDDGTSPPPPPPPPPVVPTVSVTGGSVAEGNTGTTKLPFVVQLSQASTATITVDYTSANGTATAGSDYVAASGRLTFAPGETRKTVDISVVGDTTVEPDERLELRLSNPTGATAGTLTASGTIRNDDVAPPPPPPPSNPNGVVYKVRDDWGAGFVADLTVKNTSATAWKNWTLSFDLDATITNIWNAEIVSRVGNRYTIRAASWNRSVAPNASVGFGFQASTAVGRSRAIGNVVLQGS